MFEFSDHSELVAIIGDVLTDLDYLRTNTTLSPERKQDLDELRDRLDAAQLKLVRDDFEADTAAIQTATQEVKGANEKIRKTIERVDKFASNIETVAKIVSIVERLVGIADGF